LERFSSRLLIWGVVGFLAQFIDGTLGMGYGAFSATLLIAAGLSPAIASASVHTAEIFTTLVSGGSHLFFGNVKKEWLLPLVIPGIIGGIGGAYFISSMPSSTMKPFVAGFLLLLGILVLYRFIRRKAVTAGPQAGSPGEKNSHGLVKSSVKFPVLGLVAAFMDAVGGGGWGPIATPGLILTGNTEPRKVIGTVNLAEFFVTIAESATFMIILGWEAFDWGLVGALLLGGVIAAPIAAYLCKRLPIKVLGILIGLLLVGLNLRTLLMVLS